MCFRFLPNSEETGALRGAPVFAADQRAWQRSKIMRATGHEILITEGSQSIQIRPCEQWFLLMPGHLQVAELIEERPFRAIVVDYHADVLQLMDLDDASPASKEAGATVPRESWEWWSHPDRQESMTRSLRAADVITTPFPEYIPALKAFTPRVVLLPDVKKGGSGPWLPFRKAWDKNVRIAIEEAILEREGR